MKRRKLVFYVVILTVGFGVLCYGIWRGHVRNQALDLRVADVGTLLSVLGDVMETNTTPQMSDLLAILERSRARLSNPLAKDASMQSYRIAPLSNAISLGNHDTVLIEETDNVDDGKLCVRGFADGSVRITRKEIDRPGTTTEK